MKLQSLTPEQTRQYPSARRIMHTPMARYDSGLVLEGLDIDDVQRGAVINAIEKAHQGLKEKLNLHVTEEYWEVPDDPE